MQSSSIKTTNQKTNLYSEQTKLNKEPLTRSISFINSRPINNATQNITNKIIKLEHFFVLPDIALENILTYLDIPTCLSLRSVNKLLNEQISIDLLISNFCATKRNYNEKNFSYFTYKNFIEPCLYNISPSHKKKIDQYITNFPEKKLTNKFSKFLFKQIYDLQNLNIEIALQQSRFETKKSTLDLPENTKLIKISKCGQYLLTLNTYNEIILWVFKGINGLKELSVIKFYSEKASNFIQDISFTPKGNILVVTENNVDLWKLNSNPFVAMVQKILSLQLQVKTSNIATIEHSNNIILSADEKSCFIITPAGNLTIGSIINDKYTQIQQINHVKYFNVGNNNKLLILIDDQYHISFYEKNTTNTWSFIEKTIKSFDALTEMIKIEISEDCQSCYFGSANDGLLHFQKKNKRMPVEKAWYKVDKPRYLVGRYNTLYFFQLPYMLYDNKLLLICANPRHVISRYKLYLYNTKHKNFLRLSMKTNSSLFKVHPSKLAIFSVSTDNKHIELYNIKKLSLIAECLKYIFSLMEEHPFTITMVFIAFCNFVFILCLKILLEFM